MGELQKPVGLKAINHQESFGRTWRWLGFLFALALAFWGIHLIKTSSYSWLWFLPLLIPALMVMGYEYEQSRPLGKKNPEASKYVRLIHSTAVVVVWVVAILGFYLMMVAQPAWYWFAPLITPAIVILPGKFKEWEKQETQNEQQEPQEELLEVRSSHSIYWRIIKLGFWLGLLALIWYIGGYYVLVWLLG